MRPSSAHVTHPTTPSIWQNIYKPEEIKKKKIPETPNPNYCVSHHPRPPERLSVVVSINWQPGLKPPTISHIFPPPISHRDPRKPAAKLPHTALRFTVFRHRLPATATARLFLIILSILLDHLLQQPTPFTEIEVKPPTTSFFRLFRPIHDDPRQTAATITLNTIKSSRSPFLTRFPITIAIQLLKFQRRYWIQLNVQINALSVWGDIIKLLNCTYSSKNHSSKSGKNDRCPLNCQNPTVKYYQISW